MIFNNCCTMVDNIKNKTQELMFKTGSAYQHTTISLEMQRTRTKASCLTLSNVFKGGFFFSF